MGVQGSGRRTSAASQFAEKLACEPQGLKLSQKGKALSQRSKRCATKTEFSATVKPLIDPFLGGTTGSRYPFPKHGLKAA
jgi:hypothetical protein